jgi:hypothetical protein
MNSYVEGSGSLYSDQSTGWTAEKICFDIRERQDILANVKCVYLPWGAVSLILMGTAGFFLWGEVTGHSHQSSAEVKNA